MPDENATDGDEFEDIASAVCVQDWMQDAALRARFPRFAIQPSDRLLRASQEGVFPNDDPRLFDEGFRVDRTDDPDEVE